MPSSFGSMNSVRLPSRLSFTQQRTTETEVSGGVLSSHSFRRVSAQTPACSTRARAATDGAASSTGRGLTPARKDRGAGRKPSLKRSTQTERRLCIAVLRSAAVTKTRSAVLALIAGAAVAVIFGVVAHFSSGRVSVAGAVPLGVVLAVAFYFMARRGGRVSRDR